MRLLSLFVVFLCTHSCSAWLHFLADLKFIGTSYSDYKSLFLYSSVSNVLGTKYFDKSKPSVLIIHGWRDSFKSETASTLINAFLIKSEYNIIFGDWSSCADDVNYSAAVEAVGKVASIFVTILKGLKSSYDLSKIYIVGHSLGAQLGGRIGDSFRSEDIFLERMTGLDPAGPLFVQNFPFSNFVIPFAIGKQKFDISIGRSLSKEDALFVDIIHTNAGSAGSMSQSGHLDFWPNGGRVQQFCVECLKPASMGCRTCSHAAAWKLYAESVKSTESKFTALKCPENGTIFTKEECIGPETASMGFYASKNSKTGNYFFEIN